MDIVCSAVSLLTDKPSSKAMVSTRDCVDQCYGHRIVCSTVSLLTDKPSSKAMVSTRECVDQCYGHRIVRMLDGFSAHGQALIKGHGINKKLCRSMLYTLSYRNKFIRM